MALGSAFQKVRGLKEIMKVYRLYFNIDLDHSLKR